MKYRKKPVVIEAVQYTGDNWKHLAIWIGRTCLVANDANLVIETLEGNHTATIGDFIIQGVKGEFYPCKPEIFDMTYEVAE